MDRMVCISSVADNRKCPPDFVRTMTSLTFKTARSTQGLHMDTNIQERADHKHKTKYVGSGMFSQKLQQEIQICVFLLLEADS